MSRICEKDVFFKNYCGAANPCVCPYDLPSIVLKKSHADVFYRQKPASCYTELSQMVYEP